MINLLSKKNISERVVKEMKKSKKKGFTLIELIVVIAILGILAAIAVPRLSGFQDSAKRKSDIATGKNIATAVATLIADQKINLPSTGTGTETIATNVTPVAPGAAVAVADSDGYIATYLQSIPKTKDGGTTWTITVTSTGDVSVYAASTADSTCQVFPTLGSKYSN